MTRVGNYQMTATAQGYVLTAIGGERVGVFPTARAANAHAVALTAAAYKLRTSA